MRPALRRLFLAALVLGAACALPSTVVRTPDSRPGLAISGAPAGSLLLVDGKSAGEARRYDGGPGESSPRVLLVEPGTHEVEIVDAAGKVLFRQRVFLDSETKTIQVH